MSIKRYRRKILGSLSIILLAVISFYCIALPKAGYIPKIYDCFLFYNELELLEIRLNEMYDHVDKIVLVEACETFRGQQKPFYFAENRHLFEKFADKIIYVPIEKPLETDDPWTRERFQRSQIFRGLKGCRDEDVIFLSDLDEIVRGSKIQEIAALISSHQLQAAVCEQKMYFGYLNRYQGPWHGTVCTSVKEAKRLSMKYTRRMRRMTPKALKKKKIHQFAVIENAGWHFTSMGGLDRYIKKIESYSHVEYDNPERKKNAYMRDVIASLICEEVDEAFPQYVRERKEHFEEIGFLEKT